MNYLSNMYRHEDDDEPPSCPFCGGKGYIPHRGEPMAADPCGHCDGGESDQETAP
jgi:DnaJ-class molecular chaperone